MEIRELGEKLTSLLNSLAVAMAISGFPPNQPVSLYEAALANRVIIMRRLNRGDYSGLAEYIAFSARPWENGQLSALASNRSIRRKERGRGTPLRRGTNKLCLAQMGEKGEGRLSLEWGPQVPIYHIAAANYCGKMVQIVYLFGKMM